MLNTVYRLTQPRKIEIAFNEIDIFSENVIVRPTYLSICNADQRYFQGTRDPKALAEKLPMALIHEAVGEVVYSRDEEFKPGDFVVMIPNTPTETDDVIAENYLRSSKFRASGFDGFMQEYVSISADRLVKLPADINPAVASFDDISDGDIIYLPWRQASFRVLADSVRSGKYTILPDSGTIQCSVLGIFHPHDIVA